jgi:ABC-type spermidine/putrescine transport system permease subunit II
MKSSRIALIAAAAAVGCWTLKAIAIGMAGGLGKSPFEGPLFFAGLVSFVIAAVSLGVALTVRARTWQRIFAGVGAFGVGLVGFLVVDGLVASMRGPEESAHWVWMELNLWIMGTVGLLVALHAHRRGSGHRALA